MLVWSRACALVVACRGRQLLRSAAPFRRAPRAQKLGKAGVADMFVWLALPARVWLASLRSAREPSSRQPHGGLQVEIRCASREGALRPPPAFGACPCPPWVELHLTCPPRHAQDCLQTVCSSRGTTPSGLSIT